MTGLVHKFLHVVLWKTHYSCRKVYNYEIIGILWRIKQIM